MSRLKLALVAISCSAALLAPRATAETRSGPATLGTSTGETDFDAYTRDHLERHEPRGRKPAGWVGPWPPSNGAETAPEGASGGGDVPPLPADPEIVFTDVAVPPPEVQSPAVPPVEQVEVAHVRPPATPPVPGTPRSGERKRAGDGKVAPYSSSTGAEAEPVNLYTRVGVVTLIEFKTGERPSGGAFCGDCARVMQDGQVSEEGMFIVEEMADKVSIRPREGPRDGGRGLLTNLHIVTDTGRTLTFNLYDADSRGVPPTQRHEVRASGGDSSVLASSIGDQLARANRALEESLKRQLEERESGVVAEKAARRMDAYTDTDVEKKAGGRKLVIEAATTLGDETVIRMRVQAAEGDVSDPVALLEAGGRARILKTRSVLRQPEASSLVITLSVEGVVLGEDQRIAVSMRDRRTGEELRSSVGRG